MSRHAHETHAEELGQRLVDRERDYQNFDVACRVADRLAAECQQAVVNFGIGMTVDTSMDGVQQMMNYTVILGVPNTLAMVRSCIAHEVARIKTQDRLASVAVDVLKAHPTMTAAAAVHLAQEVLTVARKAAG